MKYVAWDISSQNLGWALYRDGERNFSGVLHLKGDIHKRMLDAFHFAERLPYSSGVYADAFVVESPAVQHAKGAIPQLYVAGVVRLAALQRRIPIIEVSPSEAKKALTGNGQASKRDVLVAAAPSLGYDPKKLVYQQGKRFQKPTKSGDWRAWSSSGVVLFEEHEADAIAVGVAAVAHWRSMDCLPQVSI